MHLVIWQYDVQPDRETEFERTYGPDGQWCTLFARAEGYLGTHLWRSTHRPNCYLTLDRWQSREHYERFISTHATEYAAIDQACAELTVREQQISGRG